MKFFEIFPKRSEKRKRVTKHKVNKLKKQINEMVDLIPITS